MSTDQPTAQPVPEQPAIDPGLRAQLDQELTGAVAGLLGKAAAYDGRDLIEANVDFANWLLDSAMGQQHLAASAAMLALRLHRSGGTR